MRRVFMAAVCVLGVACGSNDGSDSTSSDSTSSEELRWRKWRSFGGSANTTAGAPNANGGATNVAGAPNANGGATNVAGAPSATGGATNVAGAPNANGGAANVAGAPSATGGATNVAGAPNANGGAINAAGGAVNGSGGAPSASADVIDFCRGRVTDKNSHPTTTLAKPAVGTWVSDPDFPGAQIMRITNSGTNQATTPMYSTIPAWNSDGSLLMLYQWGAGHVLYDGRTFAKIGSLDCQTSTGARPGPSDVEHVMWDPTNPDILRYPSRYAPDSRGSMPILYKCNVRTHQASVDHDFSTAPTSCTPGSEELTMGADPQWFPGGLVGLQCGNNASDSAWRGKKFVYDVNTGKVFTPRSGGSFTGAEAPIAAPSGNRVYFGGAVYDNDLNPIRSLNLASIYEHANVGRSKLGNDFYYAVDFDGSDPGVMIAHDMSSGQTVPLISESGGWGYPGSGIHITSIIADARAAGWSVASIVGSTTTEKLAGEILLANVDTKAVCRAGRHRSRAGNGGYGYAAEPHPVSHVLPDGTLEIVFGSDWGGQSLADTYIMRLKPM
ncbi:MAG: hypothetical protein ACOY0T_25285 [Myxococcota bacterium]